MPAIPWILGAHLFTAHSASDTPEFVTPGLYVCAPSGFTAGMVRNSYGHVGGYAAWTWQTTGALSVALTAGGITGYKAQEVRAMLVPSLRLGADHARVRLSFLPKTPQGGRSNALTLSVESPL